ncbi:DUF2461 domain-containing protein [Nocardioides limicola]|uniref:DUF2461 domain-containing protein n=1 Tax=Nocardioides limicola TaxID=2803368 RepID=UPI00193BF8B9|nr:DUF2461 domain-containing protein [Nocardioides sp. DJM-14]
MTFQGFPVAALDFYDDLEVDNTKSFWESHKDVYKEQVHAPMVALTDALAPEFGAAKVFRPYRDVRFSRDKAPYKTHQGAFVGLAPAAGWYVELSARGVRVGGGFYEADSTRLAAFRAAVQDRRQGAALERVVAQLNASGWTIEGDRLKTSPRGISADHPRIELLRHRSLVGMRSYGFEPVIHTPELLDRIRADWRALHPLNDWCATALAE